MVFSIIIPVHNGIKYLKSSVESALGQDTSFYKENIPLYEIIIVENGSTDGTDKIADSLAKENPIVTVIHEGPVGLYAARQIGIKNAKGDWIIALDSDDLLYEGAVRELYAAVAGAKKSSEMIDLIYFNVAEIGREENKLFDLPFLPGKVYSGSDKEPFYQLLCTGDSLNSMWSKAIRREIAYLDREVLFLNYGEDLYQTVQYVDRAKGIGFLEGILYYYRENDSSITSSYSSVFLDNQKCVWQMVDEMAEKWRVPGADELLTQRKALTCTIALARIVYSDMSIRQKREKLKDLMKDEFYVKYASSPLPQWAPEEDVFLHELQTAADPYNAIVNNARKYNLKSAVKKVLGRR